MVEQEGKQLEFPSKIIPPPESSKVESGRRKRFLKNVGPSLLLLIGLGLSGYGGHRIAKDFILPLMPKVNDEDLRENKRGIEGLEAYYSEYQSEQDTDEFNRFLIAQYQQARVAFHGYSEYELKTDYSDNTLEFVQNGRRALLIDGSDLVNRIANGQELVIDQDEEWIQTGDVVFSFGNTYQEFILNGIITQSLVMNHPGFSPPSKLEAKKKREDLLWLARQDLPVVVKPDSYGLPPENVLINMARFYREIKRLGYPIPSEILFKFYPGEGPGGGYDDRTNEMFITNNSGEGTVIHEWAHNQADENEEFGQGMFNERFFPDSESLTPVDLNFEFFVNPGVLGKDSIEGVMNEDYAETIRMYFEDGVGFRLLLKTLYIGDKTAFDVLWAKYNFAREFFGGKEFLTNGEVFKPKPGDIFSIRDPDPSRVPIGLRPEPIFDPVSGTPVVYDSDTVEIVEGPKEVKMSDGDKAKMWKVVVVFPISGLGKEEILVYSESSGWIWDIWLGSKSLPAEIANNIPHSSY